MCNCDTFNTEKYKGIPYLDVTTVYSKETGFVFVNVVNRHKDKDISADIINISGNFKGNAEVSTVKAESLDEAFSIDKQSQYIPIVKDIVPENNKMTCTFPPHSFTQIKMKVH